MGYYEQKAKRAYEFYLKGLPLKKVYAAVEKDGKYLVLKNAKDPKYKYSLAGGGVEDDEDNVSAIKREIDEELGVKIEVLKNLGTIKYIHTWHYEGKAFDVNYEAEIYLTKCISDISKNFGLEGEFGKNIAGKELISKEEMLKNVAEFITFGIKLD